MSYMAKQASLAISIGLLVAAAGAARAADLPVRKGPPALEPPISDWTLESGFRYWYSIGRYQKDLYDPFVPGQMNSRLTYKGQAAHSAEGFARLDHSIGVFLKGFVGAGAIVSGRMFDEDFPPGTVPYSNTLQSSRDGMMKYLTIDAGYTFLRGPIFEAEAFVGYARWRERYNTYGCSQVATNAGICGVVPPAFGPIGGAFNGLDEDLRANAVRLGGAAKFNILPKLALRLEGAFLVGGIDSNDYHNFRPDIRGIPEDGRATGFQLEAIATYDVTENFSIGAGARWWKFTAANGKAHWEQTVAGIAAGGIPPAPLKMEMERYGFFVQAAYKFGKSGQSAGPVSFLPFLSAEQHDWTGLHVGVTAGSAFGSGGGSVTAASPTAALFQTINRLPTDLRPGSHGFLAGAQVGYDHQFDKFVVGAEADISYAHIAATTAVADVTTLAFDTTVRQNVSWLATARLRAGFVPFGATLFYATGGLALGGVEQHSAFTSAPGGSCALFWCSYGQSSGTAVGWTIGAGMEVAINSNVTFKSEYLYADLGQRQNPVYSYGAANVFGVPVNYMQASSFANHVFRSGLNYKFDLGGSSPVVAKY